MRLRVGWVLATCVTILASCRPPAAPTPDSAFRNLRRVSVSDADALPQGELRLTAYVTDVGATNNGTFLALSDTPNDDQRIFVVYGSPGDVLFAQYSKGQHAELEFSVIERTKLSDGTPALRVNLTGMRVAGSVEAGAP